ncbi:MAG: biotin carboxylase N-terminal domain-containing protein [Acidimicrobiia bacterium]
MIRRVLVANRGEIARRVFRTCARLRIATVAVYSDSDAKAPHVDEADTAIRLAGRSPAETYLDQEALVEAALTSGADAVHPGYGFLSENAGFARAVTAAGLTWIGPPPEAIAAMGSKIEAKKLMTGAGVRCLPGADLTGLSPAATFEEAAAVGYPVLVKASAGGGGKGMRIVESADSLADAVDAAKREAANAFGDATVFLEKYLTGPRHIEIQVFGDQHGNVVSLHERECSIQRRHQKIIEESPSPAIDEETRKRMGDAAVAAAKAVDYVGAGTVEFLFDNDRFFFLEMNTRLQVEHPVTEMVTGLDLVELQIDVANGSPLPPRAFDAPIEGHAIEARIYAEDPAKNFLPDTGLMHRFAFPMASEVRVDSGVEAGSVVSVFFDPMLAKVIVHAPDRDAAAKELASVLRRAEIHGPTTNRDLLVRVLEHSAFLAGEADTSFIESTGLEVLANPLVATDEVPVRAAAAAAASRAVRVASSPVPQSVPRGFRNVGVANQQISYLHGDNRIDVVYGNDKSGMELIEPAGMAIASASTNTVELSRDGESLRLSVAQYGEAVYVDSAAGSVRLVEVSRYPTSEATRSEGSLRAPMPGRIVRVEVEEGDPVTEGAALVVLEAMKMEHTLRSPHDGVVTEITHRVDDQVETNDVLIVVEAHAVPSMPST